MSADSFPLDFDFGNWCSVCDTAIPGPSDPTTIAPEEAIKITSKNSRRSSSGVNGKRPDGTLVSGKKSSSKLSRLVTGVSNGLGSKGSTSRNKSHTSLASLGLAPSTPMIPAPEIDDELPQAVFNPPSSLYCSEECQRLDELRSRLALGLNLEPPLTLNSKRNALAYTSSSIGGAGNGGTDEMSKSMARRRSSGVSQSGSSVFSNGPDYFHHYHSTSGKEALEFSTRRNSRGSGENGAYSYRASWRSISKSDEEGDQGLMSSSAQQGSSSTDSLSIADPSVSSEERMSSSHSGVSYIDILPPQHG